MVRGTFLHIGDQLRAVASCLPCLDDRHNCATHFLRYHRPLESGLERDVPAGLLRFTSRGDDLHDVQRVFRREQRFLASCQAFGDE
jgi:hypothetical protein